MSRRNTALSTGEQTGLTQVKEDGWTGFSKGWQGCSKGFLKAGAPQNFEN